MTKKSAPTPTEWRQAIDRRRVLQGGAVGGLSIVGGGLLASCGSSSSETVDTVTDAVSDTTDAATDAVADAGDAMVAGPFGDASGDLTIGSNASDEAPKAGLAAVVAAFPNDNVNLSINTVDHNTYQENINTYLQSEEDDVMAWFAGFRNKFFADQGLVGDISDVWAEVDGLGAGFKAASTASDGKQYFMPTSYYTWAVNYSKSLFSENGYEEPSNVDELLALAEQMQSDGITPFVFANDGQWPIMGTFDVLNMRINGYDYHIDLMGGNEKWNDTRTRDVFTTWESLLPYHMEGANGRTWQEGAQALQDGTAGMYLLGTFAASHSEELAADMDFFNFPEIDPAIGASALDAPIDGYQMIANPKNPPAAKEFLLHLSTAVSQDAYLSEDPSVVASSSNANTGSYNDLQKKSAALAGAATGISQFADRDTIPDFASNVLGPMLAEFIEDPSGIESALDDAQEQWEAISADYS